MPRVAAPGAAEPHTKKPVMEDGSAYAGLDAHQKSIAVTVLAPGQAPVEDRLANVREALGRWVSRLRKMASGEVA